MMNTKEQLLRDHRLYHRWFRELSSGKILYNADKSLKTKKDIKNNHAFLVKQMLKDRIDHYLVDDLDESLDDGTKKVCMVKDLLKLPREHVIIKDFASLQGDGLVIKTKLVNNGALIDVNQSVDMIKRILKGEDYSVQYTTASSEKSTPVYDLILRRKMTTLPKQPESSVKLWLGDCTEKPEEFIGMNNIISKNVDMLLDFGSQRIPFADGSISELVFCRALTQTYSPSAWMKEAHRVLTEDGLLYFEELSLKNRGHYVHPYDNSYITKEFFAFWVIPELLGNRPKFDLVNISESSLDEDFEDLTLIRGTLKVSKVHGVISSMLSDSCAIVNAKIIQKDDTFGIYKIGLKFGDKIIDVGSSYPAKLELNVDDKVSTFVSGFIKENDKISAQQIIILSKNDPSKDIDSVEQVLEDQEEEKVKFKVIKQDKDSDEYHLVYGVVAEPDLEDSDGHWSSADDIREDAHNFLAKRRNVKLSHFLPVDSEVVESYMSPVDWVAPDGQKILKDSWIAVIRVKESKIWDSVEDGTIVGLSKGGVALTV